MVIEKDVDLHLEDVEIAVRAENGLEVAYSKDDKANDKVFDSDNHTYCLDSCLFNYFAKILFNVVLCIVDHKLNKHKGYNSKEVYLYNLKA